MGMIHITFTHSQCGNDPNAMSVEHAAEKAREIAAKNIRENEHDVCSGTVGRGGWHIHVQISRQACDVVKDDANKKIMVAAMKMGRKSDGQGSKIARRAGQAQA